MRHLLLLLGLSTLAQAQAYRVVVTSSPDPSADVFAIAPITSWTGAIALAKAESKPETITPELKAWLDHVSPTIGLASPDLQPWHAVISYQLYDHDGNPSHNGTFEELWASGNRYRVTYKSNDLNQTDYVTDNGLFRTGDQRWPTPFELAVRTAFTDPFDYARTLYGFEPQQKQLSSGSLTLTCTELVRTSSGSSNTEFCFEPGTDILRYSHTQSWIQTAFNDISVFQGHPVPREIVMTDGGKPHAILHITTLEPLTNLPPETFSPPPDAVRINNQRLRGVALKPLHMEFPQWPSNISDPSFSVTVQIVVGKDGRVIEAHAISGPEKARSYAEKVAMKWRFQPYVVAGQPSEAEAQIQLNKN